MPSHWRATHSLMSAHYLGSEEPEIATDLLLEEVHMLLRDSADHCGSDARVNQLFAFSACHCAGWRVLPADRRAGQR